MQESSSSMKMGVPWLLEQDQQLDFIRCQTMTATFYHFQMLKSRVLLRMGAVHHVLAQLCVTSPLNSHYHLCLHFRISWSDHMKRKHGRSWKYVMLYSSCPLSHTLIPGLQGGRSQWKTRYQDHQRPDSDWEDALCVQRQRNCCWDWRSMLLFHAGPSLI